VIAGGVANVVAGSAPAAAPVNLLRGDAAGFDRGTTGRWFGPTPTSARRVADVRGPGALRVERRAVADLPRSTARRPARSRRCGHS